MFCFLFSFARYLDKASSGQLWEHSDKLSWTGMTLLTEFSFLSSFYNYYHYYCNNEEVIIKDF